MKKVKVLVAVDHGVMRRIMARELDRHEGIQVVGEARDSAEVLDQVIRLQPDVLVLDMMMPRMDGIALLEQMQRILDIPHPAIIALISCDWESTRLRMMNLCVSRYLTKPISLDTLVQCVLEIGGGAPGPQRPGKVRTAEELGHEMLTRLNVPTNLLGYRCLRCALKESCNETELLFPLSRGLYMRVAQQQALSEKSVERAIRYAIAQAWSRGGAEKYRQLLGRHGSIVGDKPTNSEFIAQITEWIRMQMRQ